MIRTEKTVITNDGYIIKKHTITLYPNRYYTIIKDGQNRGWYTYRELFDALAILRAFESTTPLANGVPWRK